MRGIDWQFDWLSAYARDMVHKVGFVYVFSEISSFSLYYYISGNISW